MADTFYAEGHYFNSWEEYQDYLQAKLEERLNFEMDYLYDTPDPFEDR